MVVVVQQAQSSTLITSPTPGSSSPTPTPYPSTATEAITSVTTVTGQAKTIIIPAPSATADPTLGQGSVSSNGISKGTVVGIVVGVALGIGLLIGLIVWFCVTRRHAGSTVGSTPPFGATPGSSNPSHSGIPSRQVSQMSSAGLLAGKAPRIQATGYGMSNGLRSTEITSGFSNDRRSLGTDQRLNPYALFAHDEARQSNISLQDNQDYSRQLRVKSLHSPFPPPLPFFFPPFWEIILTWFIRWLIQTHESSSALFPFADTIFKLWRS
jgi:hypothetical protein